MQGGLHQLAQDGINQRFKLAERLVDRLKDIKAGTLNYRAQKMQWPTTLSDIVADGFYIGQFSTPYNNDIVGAASGNTYVLTFSAESTTVAKHIASQMNGSSTLNIVTLNLPLPSQSAAVSTTLNRFHDASGILNTMQTDLYMGNNSLYDIGNVNAETVNASLGVFDRGQRVYSAGFKPTPEALGAVPETRTINGHSLAGNLVLTKADIGLSKVNNYGISDAYSLNSSTTYASSKAVAQLKSHIEAGFVPTNRTINGKALSGNITLSPADVGAIATSTPSLVNANTTWLDNYATSWGAAGDLSLHHDGNNNFIRSVTSDLYIDNTANGREIYLRSNNNTGTNHTAIGVMSDTNVYAQLAFNSSNKLATTNTGVNVSGTVQSSGWQTTYMNALHTGNSFYLRPNDEDVWQTSREFGYDANNNRWFVETDLAVSGSISANDVTAAGTSMSAIKTFMDNADSGGKVESLYEGVGTVVNLTKNLVIGATYYIQTGGYSGTSTCRTSHIIDNQFILLKFTGVGQTAQVQGYCSPSGTSATLTVASTNQLTTNLDYSFDVVIRKVIRIN